MPFPVSENGVRLPRYNQSTRKMKTLLAILLIVVGAIVFFQGFNRKDSLAGEAAEAGTSIANAVDGGTRTPQHVVSMVIGGALVIVGIGLAVRRGPPSAPINR